MRSVAAVALLALLALTGCSTVSPPEAGLTESQIAEIYQVRADFSWQATGLADDLRPAELIVQKITSDEWAGVLADCMNSAGFENYQNLGGGLSVEEVQRSDAERQAEVISYYSCRAALRIVDQEEGWLNPTQVDYSYEYFHEVLVPCLATHGVDVLEAPTRNQFSEQNGQWNPYNSIKEASFGLLAANESILAECPSNPPGMNLWEFTADSFQVDG